MVKHAPSIAKSREDFPLLARTVHGKPLVYLDSAASAQKPTAVLAAMENFLRQNYANVHRGLHHLGNQATTAYEDARATAADFIKAACVKEIVFTSGGTDAINLVANSFLAPDIKPGDEIILSVLEHHSNIVPWHFLRERYGAVLRFVPCACDGSFCLEKFERYFSKRTKMVAITQMSNALGVMPPLADIIARAHAHQVPVLVDGCQGVVHEGVDVQTLDCDFYAFTGHKLYGPTGIGVLYGKQTHLQNMRPYRGGGEMIDQVTQDTVTYGKLPYRFEAGTPPIVEAVGLAAAMEYVTRLGMPAIHAHEQELLQMATDALSKINRLHIIGTAKPKGAIVSFTVDGVHPHDLATVMDKYGVAVRAGHHCAQPLMEHLNLTATTRASFALYNNASDVSALVDALTRSIAFFD